MKEKVVPLIAAAVLAVSMAACGNGADEGTSARTNAAVFDEQNAGADEYYERGRACLYGTDGTEVDYEEAYNSFVKAEEMGKTEANFYLGLLCDFYSYPREDYGQAKAYYEKCGDNLYAKIALGILYTGTEGIERDEEKAKLIFQEAIDAGLAEGYLGNAILAYDRGDYEEAFQCCNQALEGTEQAYVICAMSNIGALYYGGRGVKQNYGKAMEWYKKAADLGYKHAMCEMGWLYYMGYGVKQNYAKAMKWYEQAGDSIDETGMFCMGHMYENGYGVEQDYAEAIEWYEKAAALNYEGAMHQLGMMYFYGNGVEQDYAKAMEWFEKAAALGVGKSIYNLGMMYEYGCGVKPDYTKAMEWYKKAENLGEPLAAEGVRRLYEKGY